MVAATAEAPDVRPRELTVTAAVTVRFALVGLMEARPDAATVAELLAMVRGMLDDERTRGQGLDAKSATLAGFTGTILALTTTLGAELLDLDLGSVGSACLPVPLRRLRGWRSGLLWRVALVGVLRPQPRLALAMDEIPASRSSR